MRISDWSSDVCSSDLNIPAASSPVEDPAGIITSGTRLSNHSHFSITELVDRFERGMAHRRQLVAEAVTAKKAREAAAQEQPAWLEPARVRSEEHTSELQSLMRISYAVFCLKKKKNKTVRQWKYETQYEHVTKDQSISSEKRTN